MNLHRRLIIAATGIAVFAAVAAAVAVGSPGSGASVSQASEPPNQVLEWNQIFIETLIATNTPNSSSQRLGAIVHTAIFDAYNGIERRYTPIFVQNVDRGPPDVEKIRKMLAEKQKTKSSVTFKDALDLDVSAMSAQLRAALTNRGQRAPI